MFIAEVAENPGIAPLWAQLAEAPGTETTLQVPPEFAERVLFGKPPASSSLTTPPCSEGVKWYVRKTPTQLSKEQIASFTTIYDHNNRPVQALGKHGVYFDENPKVSIH